MAGFQAGTVFVDVVPSMKGFLKEINADVKSQMPTAGNEAARSFADAFKKTTSSTGADIANSFADPLGKTTARLKQEATTAGQALASAQKEVAASSGNLAQARSREEAAAKSLVTAENSLNQARASGNAAQIARAEEGYAQALDRSKAANKAADQAAADHSRAMGKAATAARDTDQAVGALASKTGRTKREVAEANPALKTYATNLGQVDVAAEKAGVATAQTGAKVSSVGALARSAIAPVLALGAAVGIGGFASEAIEASDATDKFVSTLRFSGLDTSTIDRLKESAQKYADETVYDLADIQQITAQLASNGVDGFDKLAEAAGNLNAVAGGNADTFRSVGMVMTQTAGQGKLTTENFNQLSDAIPGASGKIQKALLDMGAYTGNFRDAMQKGEISADEFNAAILQLGSDETAVAAARSTKTIEGAAGNLQATVVGAIKDLIDYVKPAITGLMGWMADAIGGSVTWIKQHKDEMQALAIGVGVAVAAYAGFSILTSVITWIRNTTLAQHGLNAAMRANPIGFVITAIALLVTGLVLLYKKNEAFRLKVQELGRTVVEIWQQHIQPAISAVWDWISGTLLPGIQSVWNLLTKGDFDGNLFGLEEDSAFVDFLLTLREGAIATGEAISNAWTNVIQPALSALWSWVTGTLAPALADFWTGVVQPVWSGFATVVSTAWTNVISPVLSGLWSFISNVLIPVLQFLWVNVVQPVWSGFGAVVSTAWNSVIYPALSALWGWLTTSLVPALQGLWNTVQPVWQSISSVISDAWNSVIYPALVAFWGWIKNTLAPALQEFWTTVVQPVWTSISTFIASAWTNVIQPALSALWSFITGVLVPIIQFLWVNVVQPTFQLIGAAIQTAWEWVIKPALMGLWMFISTVLAPIFMFLWTNVVKPVWQGISTTISTVVDFLSGTVFPKIKTAIDNAKSGFETFKSGVQTAMNAIKGAAATPINFVINTVYTGGIKKMFDTVAEKVGLSLRLPSVSAIPGYASGGQWRTMMPGYTPGKDVFHFYSPDGGGAIRLSGGEGIIRPDSLRALGGKDWLDRVNASRGRGLADVGDTGTRRGQVSFAKGGIWERAKGSVSSAASWVANAASAVADIVSDPIGAITDLVISPAKALLSSTGSSFWAQAAAAIPPLWFESLKNIFKSKTEESGLSGGSGLVGAARKAIGVPYVWGGSSIPPGLDCSGLVYWAAQQLGLGWPRLTAAGYQSGSTPISWNAAVPGDLLFWGSPAHHVAIFAGGGKMVEEPREGLSGREVSIWGSPTVGRYGGARKYDAGGWLPPGVSTAVNQTRSREAVLTSRQWSDVSALAVQGASNEALLAGLDGTEVRLVVDDSTALDAHVEVIAAGVLDRRARTLGRGRR
ncbi:tape measure protein [Actinomyces johnsonii]|uniref:Tape measure protein n=1 Tax=Actinomyces johnsonii TaxID=544581 RepID=A0A507ZVP7_9ACTO|nr:tape measure protein [Actinomyces johnsonii]KAA8738487.1 tape measure protein [Actinomyces johnsonii]TQD41770.1 tape measure protein [Actinomyces johnsonii]